MVCLGFEPRAAGWKARTNPLSFGGTPNLYTCKFFCRYLQLGKREQKSSQVEFIYKKRALSSTLLCVKNSFFG